LCSGNPVPVIEERVGVEQRILEELESMAVPFIAPDLM
jgi:hypothetical protein